MLDDGEFPIRKMEDEEGELVIEKSDEMDYLHARNGDHLMIRFQCELCHFRNIQGMPPTSTEKDKRLLRFIKRANLDAMWSRKPSTVNSNTNQIKQMIRAADDLGMKVASILPTMGPAPLKDEMGMGLAVLILKRSLMEGKNESTIQFNTARRWRSAFSNVWHASAEGLGTAIAVRGTTKLTESTSPSNALWFERFMEGMHRRMGDKTSPDLALSVETILQLLKDLSASADRAKLERDWKRYQEVLYGGVFVAVGFGGGLRGEEIMLLDTCGVLAHHEDAKCHYKYPHVVVALAGKFKGESGQRYHYMPMVFETQSGVKLAEWMGRMVDWCLDKGWRHGPFFRNSIGGRLKAAEVSDVLLEHLSQVQREHPGLLPENVKISEEFGTSRSMRRSSTSQAINVGVRKEVVDRNNRWRKYERSGHRNPSLEMQEHYSDVRLILNALLEYSRAL